MTNNDLKKNHLSLTEGVPWKVINLFAIPLLIGQLFQLFYGLVDTRIVGQVLGDVALASVGATTTLSDLLIGFMNGLTNGFAIIIATYFGANDEKHMKKSIGGAVSLAIGFSLVISTVSLLFLPQIFRIMNIEGVIYKDAYSYISIILGGLLATTCYNICAAILRAIGDSFTPLIFLVIASFLNIFLDYVFVALFDFGVQGAAFATIISQIVSAVLSYIYMVKKYEILRLKREDFKLDSSVLKKLMVSGGSMGFMVSFVNLGTLALQTSINTFGTDIIVAHTAARKATGIFMLPFSIWGAALATFCGQNLGAKKYDRIKKGVIQTLGISFIWCALVVLITYLFAPELIQGITATKEPDIIHTADIYLRVNTVFYFVCSVICLLRNSMQGFQDTVTPIFSSILELVGKMVVVFLLAPKIGYWAIIITEPCVWFIMVIPLIVNTIRNPIFKNKNKVAEV